MRLSNLFAGAFIASALLTACTSDEIAIPKSELYAREFVKKFGVIDPSRDLSAATHTGINVVTSKPTDVKVYADIDGKRYIFAEGRKISGKTTLTFDLPKGVNEVIVDLNGREIKTALGGTVNDKAGKNGRAIWEKENEVVKISRTDYRHLSEVGVMAFKDYLPEDKNNLGKVTQNFSFVSNGDFTIYPTYWQTNSYNTLGIYYIDEVANEMVFVPFYTNKILPIDGTKGNLLYTKNDPAAEDIIAAKDNIPLMDESNPADAATALGLEELLPSDYNNNGLTSFLEFQDEDWLIFKRRWMLKWQEKCQTLGGNFYYAAFKNNFDISYMENEAWKYYPAMPFLSGIECRAKDDTHVDITSISMGPLNNWIYPGSVKDSHPNEEVLGWKSRGIHIHIEPGVKFGMYIRTWYNDDKTPKPSIDNVDIVRLPLDENGLPKPDQYRRFYSEAKYNEVIGGSDVFGATYMYKAPTGIYRVLGFEDYGNDVHDLNDMMFFITSEDPMNIPDVKDEDKKPEPYEWLIAAEDLGGTYDWDFNDAVFAVTATHITDGEDNNKKTTEITVEPLASGGTLPIYVMFNGEIIEVKNNPDAEVGEGIAHYQIGGELHTWLNGYYRNPINVTEDKQTNTGAPITFVVNGEWSIAQHIDNPTWAEAIEYKGMGGFYVLVNRGKSLLNAPAGKVTKFDESILEDEDNIHVVKPPKEFSKQDEVVVSPEMLCMKNTWNWPKEQCGIHEVYGQFQPWLTGGTESWYGENDPVISTQVVRRK